MKEKEDDKPKQNVVEVKSLEDACRDKIGTTSTGQAVERELGESMLKEGAKWEVKVV